MAIVAIEEYESRSETEIDLHQAIDLYANWAREVVMISDLGIFNSLLDGSEALALAVGRGMDPVRESVMAFGSLDTDSAYESDEQDEYEAENPTINDIPY